MSAFPLPAVHFIYSFNFNFRYKVHYYPFDGYSCKHFFDPIFSPI